MQMEEKEGCFLILYHEFEGLSLFVRALALSTQPNLLLREVAMEMEEGQTPGPFWHINHPVNANSI